MLTTININFILNLTSILFFIGLLGVVLNRKNILTILMSIEILLLAVNLNFAALSVYLDDIVGHVFVIFILTIAAAESAIGLAIMMYTWWRDIIREAIFEDTHIIIVQSKFKYANE